ncbi:hypothetical protein Droror1_Dr00001678 [Drosera rotundifolia]
MDSANTLHIPSSILFPSPIFSVSVSLCSVASVGGKDMTPSQIILPISYSIILLPCFSLRNISFHIRTYPSSSFTSSNPPYIDISFISFFILLDQPHCQSTHTFPRIQYEEGCRVNFFFLFPEINHTENKEGQREGEKATTQGGPDMTCALCSPTPPYPFVLLLPSLF